MSVCIGRTPRRAGRADRTHILWARQWSWTARGVDRASRRLVRSVRLRYVHIAQVYVCVSVWAAISVECTSFTEGFLGFCERLDHLMDSDLKADSRVGWIRHDRDPRMKREPSEQHTQARARRMQARV